MAGKYKRSGPDVHLERKTRQAVKNKGTLKSLLFLKSCELAGVEPTKRQSMKFNHGTGLAFTQRFEAKRVIG